MGFASLDPSYDLCAPRNDDVEFVGWAKERSDVPTIYRQARFRMVGTLRFAHPTHLCGSTMAATLPHRLHAA